MQDAPVERWKMLCALAASEQDPRKLLALIQEISTLLEEKRNGSISASSAALQTPGSEITK
jgi:hypothetical protein